MAAHEKLIGSTIDLVRRNGVAGTGLSDLLEHSGVSRRSIYLSFPDGKSELVAEATRVAGDAMATLIERAAEDPDPQRAVHTFTEAWKHILEDSDFTAGCPVVAAALGRTQSPPAAEAAAEAFVKWERILASGLIGHGVESDSANSLATTIIAAIEGAVVLSLAARATTPLDHTGKHMSELIGHWVPASDI